jgi:hypothetical protein
VGRTLEVCVLRARTPELDARGRNVQLGSSAAADAHGQHPLGKLDRHVFPTVRVRTAAGPGRTRAAGRAAAGQRRASIEAAPRNRLAPSTCSSVSRLQVVLFVLLLSSVVGVASPQTGVAEKALLVGLAGVLIWLAWRPYRTSALPHWTTAAR